jgi:hypothetical protein
MADEREGGMTNILSRSVLRVCLVTTVLLFSQDAVSAAVTWASFFRQVSPGDTIVSGVTQTGRAYNADYSITINDGDANASNFATGDTADVSFVNTQTGRTAGNYRGYPRSA